MSKHPVLPLSYLFLLLCITAGSALAQASKVFVQYGTQPDVWHPAQPIEPGVDAKGDLNLSIPIMTVPGRGGLNYEIRFNYRSGIRFDQRGSWLGTGWEFDPGSITRDPHGFVVKNTDGTYTAHNVDFAASPTWQPDAYYVTLPVGSSVMTRSNTSGGTSTVLPPRQSTSGFYLTEWRPWKVEAFTQNPVTVGGVTTSVNYNGTTNKADYNKFVIRTEDGTRYVFGHPSLGTYNGLSSGTSESVEYYVSTWRLVAILGPDYTGPEVPTGSEAGSWIKLTYTAVTTATNTNETRTYKTKVQAAYLSEILTPTHKAVFGLVNRNQENFAAFEANAFLYKKLTSIKLYDRSDLTTTAQEVQLTQTERFRSPNQASEGTARLALDAVKILGKGGISTEPGYSFTYYGLVGSGGTLPTNTDFFGYYDTQGGTGTFDNNATDGTSWSLQRITFPTGGYEEYTYRNDSLASSEAAPYNTFEVNTGTPGSTSYSFSGLGGLKQGGARVTKITRSSGIGSTIVTTFSYSVGHSTGVPSKYWERADYNGALFTLTERAQAAVYYEWIKRTHSDGSSVTTYYTNPVTHSSTVKRLETTSYRRSNAGFTIVQGNQDWNWGKAYKIEHKDNNGRIVQEISRSPDLTSTKIAGCWTLPSEVKVVWGFADKVNSETFTDKGESGTASATKTTTYTHHTSSPKGTGFVKTIEETLNTGAKRKREFTYGYESYDSLNTRNILGPVVREDVAEITSGGSTLYQSATVTTWKRFQVLNVDVYVYMWKPYQVFAWNADAASSTKTSFTNWDGSTPGSAWQRKTTNDYNSHGLLKSEVDARGYTTTLTYNADGQLKTVSKGGLTREFTYDAYFGLLATVKDENLNTTTFVYDNYARLYQVKDRFGNTVTQHDYTISATPPSKIQTTQYASSSTTYETTTYLDGLGRPIQTQVKNGTGSNGTKYIVTATQYDNMGRTLRQWKPYEYEATTQSYQSGFATGARNLYGSLTNPYVETLYKKDALGRVAQIIPENAVLEGDLPAIQKFYGVGAIDTKNYSYVETTDETGKKTRQYVDTFGNEVRALAGVGTTDATTTHVIFSVLGQPLEVRPPNYFAPPGGSTAVNWVTTYVYDTQGQLRQKTSPDAGTVKYKYDQAGNLRFSRDANQNAANKILFVGYDQFNRPTKTGEKASITSAQFDTLRATITQSFENTSSNWISVNHYDTAKPNTGNFPWSIFATQINDASVVINLPKAHLTANAYKSGGKWQATLYSYDKEERYEKKYIYTEGASGVYTTINTTLGYTYNWQDRVTNTSAQVGSSTFYHWYTYNARGLLSLVYFSTGSTRPPTPDVSYSYHPTGTVASLYYRGFGSSVPYTYTLRDWVKTIGDVNSTTYPFSAAYIYEDNGNMKVADFYNKQSPATYKRYKYDMSASTAYDALNRLKSADYSFHNSGWQTSSAYDVSGITYDKNGNILTLARNKENGSTIDNLTYAYVTGKNRLSSISDAVASTAETWDAEDGSFTHDANGNVLTAPAPYAISATSYDVRNLPTSLTRSSVVTSYRYNASGQRIYKKTGTAAAEHYIVDGSVTVRFYKEDGTAHWNILAGGAVVGSYPSSGGARYYYRDHLGSTRAVINSSGTITEAHDYYAFGLLMPGRSTAGATVKEKYTGKERDAETGLDYFGARYYMAVLGRWGSVDPLDQQHSPYAYAGSNPLNNIDPSGLWYQDANGNWVAEEGDTYETFVKTTGYSEKRAFGYFLESGLRYYAFSGEVIEANTLVYAPGLENKFGETADALLLVAGLPGLAKGAVNFFSKKGGLRLFDEAEERIAEYLRNLGRKVEPNPREGVAGAGRQGDALIDGLLHEFKTLGRGATPRTIYNRINNSLRRGGQARDFVIDARGSGLSRGKAQAGITAALRSPYIRDRVDFITVIGDDFFIVGGSK